MQNSETANPLPATSLSKYTDRVNNSSICKIYDLWKIRVTALTTRSISLKFNPNIQLVYLRKYDHLIFMALQVLFQYTARHSPLRFRDLIASIETNTANDDKLADIDMAG